MSDTRDYYRRLSRRARNLHDRIDEAIHALLLVHQAVAETGNADMDMPGELSSVGRRDLEQCVENALFSTRAAERITLAHLSERDRQIAVLGLDFADEEGSAS